jgi:hypothetical protein
MLRPVAVMAMPRLRAEQPITIIAILFGYRKYLYKRAHKTRWTTTGVPDPGRSPFRLFLKSVSMTGTLTPGFGMLQKTVCVITNAVQVTEAEDSHHPPNPWPGPHGWAWQRKPCCLGEQQTGVFLP